MSGLPGRLRALAQQHERDLHALTERADKQATALYSGLPKADKAAALQQLRAGLTDLVERTRLDARSLGLAHTLAELRAIAGADAAKISIPVGADPVTTQVAGYIANAVEAARDAEDIASTDFRAHTILESEATNQYRSARDTAHSHLRSLPDAATEALGFRVARTTEQFRSVRADAVFPIIGERWSAAASACEKCRAADGELRPIGFAFTLPGPTAHARCQCLRTLWALEAGNGRGLHVGHKTDERRDDLDTRGLLWIETDLDTRAIDEETRTVKGCIVSDESIDSHGSILRAKGWDLTRYGKNPVLIWNHAASRREKSAEPEDMIGTVTVRIEGKKLVGDLHFSAKGLNPKADLLWEQVKAKIVRGLSVGFRTLKYHFEKRDGADELMVCDEQELVEVSLVPVPSNENTLTRQMRALAPDSNSAAPLGSRERHMDTIEAVGTLLVLPPGIASLLGTASVDEAVRMIAELKLTKDNLDKQVAALTQERDAARADLETRVVKEAEADVDALIEAKRVDPQNRDSALILRRSAPDAFRKMYPITAPQAPAPMAHLLRQIVPAQRPGPATPPIQEAQTQHGDNPIVERKLALQAEAKARGEELSDVDAFNRAYDDIQNQFKNKPAAHRI